MAITDVFLNRRTNPDSEATAQLIVELWSTLAQGFRPDEQAVEGAAYRERTAGLRRELAALPDGQSPDPAMQRRMMETLIGCVHERVTALHERIDQLDGSLRERDRTLRTQQLHGSWMQDEMERSRGMLLRELRLQGSPLPDGEPALLSHLIGATLAGRAAAVPAAG